MSNEKHLSILSSKSLVRNVIAISALLTVAPIAAPTLHTLVNPDVRIGYSNKSIDTVIIQGKILLASVKYKIPYSVLYSLIKHESEFNPIALNINKNGKGFDQGLMQLNSRNYPEFVWRFNNGEKYDPYNIDDNIRIGCSYLLWIYSARTIGNHSWYKTIVFWNGSKESSKVFAKKILAYSNYK